MTSHYFPSLYQHLYEMEDGHTPSGGPVRYGFEDDVFPLYSWKGYTIFSRIQVSNIIFSLIHFHAKYPVNVFISKSLPFCKLPFSKLSNCMIKC